MSRWLKWFSGVLAATLLLMIYPSLSLAAGETQQTQAIQTDSTASTPSSNTIPVQSYADVPDRAWYAKSINDWIALGILSPRQGDKFGPEFAMTRGDFAYLLAYSLGLAPSNNTAVFKDMSDRDQARYVTALQEAGLVSGYPDGTFRSSSPVTRAEAVSWIAAAKKLKPETPTSRLFRDVSPNSWFAGAVSALAETGIISGKSKDRFAPNDSLSRAEAIVLLDHSFYSPSLIQDIRDDGTVIIDGLTYRADDSVKGIFQSSNKAILRNAAIQFTSNGNTIASVENLMIGYKGALTGNEQALVFNAGGNTINGFVTVDADRIILANLEVKGELLLGRGFQSQFFASNVHVNGETVYFEDLGRPKTQIANLDIQNSDLGTMVLGNSTNVSQVDNVPIELSRFNTISDKEVHALAYSEQPDETILPSAASKLPTVIPDFPPEVLSLPKANPVLPPSVSTLAPGLHLQVADGAIVVTNGGGSQTFQAGQFGYVPSMARPPVIVPPNPSLSFVPPPSFNSGGSNVGNPPPAKDPIKVSCENVNCNVEAFAKSAIEAGLNGTIGMAIVHDGAALQYSGSSPINTLILGDSNSTGGATFEGSANIEHVVVNNSGGSITLNAQGTIGTLELTGASPINLSGSATIGNLKVPSGGDPKKLFTRPDALSNVWAINDNPLPDFCGAHPADSRCRIVVGPSTPTPITPSVSDVTYRVTNEQDRTVNFTATIANASKLYYVIVNDAPAPGADEVKNGTATNQILAGSLDVTNGAHPSFSVTLPNEFYYTIYIVAENGGRLSEVVATEFHAGPPPVPVVSGVSNEETYNSAVSPNWDDYMDTISTATLSKVNEFDSAIPYTRGTPITTNGYYVLTVTSIDPNGLTASTIVYFSVDIPEPLE